MSCQQTGHRDDCFTSIPFLDLAQTGRCVLLTAIGVRDSTRAVIKDWKVPAPQFWMLLCKLILHPTGVDTTDRAFEPKKHPTRYASTPKWGPRQELSRLFPSTALRTDQPKTPDRHESALELQSILLRSCRRRHGSGIRTLRGKAQIDTTAVVDCEELLSDAIDEEAVHLILFLEGFDLHRDLVVIVAGLEG